VKAGATSLGTAHYDNDLNAHILRLDLETYLKHAHGIATLAKTSPSLWYPLAIEVENEASEREAELMGEIDRLQRELFDAQNEIKSLIASAGVATIPAPIEDVSKEPTVDSEVLTSSVLRVSNLKQEERSPEFTEGLSLTPEQESALVNHAVERVEALRAELQKPVQYTAEGLKAKTMRENRALAKELNVPNYTKAKTEAELIELILAHVQTQQTPEGNG